MKNCTEQIRLERRTISRAVFPVLLIGTLMLAFRVQVAAGLHCFDMFYHKVSHTGYSGETAPNTNDASSSYTTQYIVSFSPTVADCLFVPSSVPIQDNLVNAVADAFCEQQRTRWHKRHTRPTWHATYSAMRTSYATQRLIGTPYAWHTETVDSEGNLGGDTSIALDSSNNPHITYYDATHNDLKYAYYDGSNWNIEIVDGTDEVGSWSSIALDSSDNPHISYYDWTNGNLKYAYYNGTWNIETVDSAGDVGEYTSIALDSENNPHISYYDETNDNLKYAYYNGSWNIETIDEGGIVGKYPSIALDNNDNPHISYHHWAGKLVGLKYAYYNGSNWEIDLVDSSGDVGMYNCIALDNSNNPYISYFDFTNNDLKYAYYNGGWNIETIDSDGHVGYFTSIAVDVNSNPHISYYDYTNEELKYAHNDGESWHIEIIDTEHNTGANTSIALDSSNNPHISYENKTQQDIKYACPNHTLSITATENGTTTPVPGDYMHKCNTYVEVTAIPDTNSVFGHWELDSVNVGSDNPYSVCMNIDHALHAVFVYDLCGDCSGDGLINSADVVYLINYLFKGGPAPDPSCVGDVNCDDVINSADVVYLINYLFKGDSPPCPECCP